MKEETLALWKLRVELWAEKADLIKLLSNKITVFSMQVLKNTQSSGAEMKPTTDPAEQRTALGMLTLQRSRQEVGGGRGASGRLLPLYSLGDH